MRFRIVSILSQIAASMALAVSVVAQTTLENLGSDGSCKGHFPTVAAAVFQMKLTVPQAQVNIPTGKLGIFYQQISIMVRDRDCFIPSGGGMPASINCDFKPKHYFEFIEFSSGPPAPQNAPFEKNFVDQMNLEGNSERGDGEEEATGKQFIASGHDSYDALHLSLQKAAKSNREKFKLKNGKTVRRHVLREDPGNPNSPIYAITGDSASGFTPPPEIANIDPSSPAVGTTADHSIRAFWTCCHPFYSTSYILLP